MQFINNGIIWFKNASPQSRETILEAASERVRVADLAEEVLSNGLSVIENPFDRCHLRRCVRQEREKPVCNQAAIRTPDS